MLKQTNPYEKAKAVLRSCLYGSKADKGNSVDPFDDMTEEQQEEYIESLELVAENPQEDNNRFYVSYGNHERIL